ncbi:MAG: hypothetical protein AAGA62_09460 [Bacteroidota bacterium]
MAYYPDFYHKSNIVGYTGNLYDAPTVYFERRTSYGIRFGHITQDHRFTINIGREKVREHSDYRMYNRGGSAREYWNGAENHTSRTELRGKRELNMQALQVLAKAIDRFPDLKPMYRKE